MLSPYEELVRAWESLRGRHGLRLREVACGFAPRTLLVVELGTALDLPVVTIAAGVHGDEPAAPWALLSLVRDGLLDPAFSYRLWPCTNPTGYAAGTRRNIDDEDINRSFDRGGRTPEARAMITANRDRRFALSLDLHEDYEAHGFYCYEPADQAGGLIGARVIEAVREAGFPLQDLSHAYDLGYPPEEQAHLTLEPGRVVYDPVTDLKVLAGMPYSLFMRRAAQRVLTFETPRPLSWEDRIGMHRTAVVSALTCLTMLEECSHAEEVE